MTRTIVEGVTSEKTEKEKKAIRNNFILLMLGGAILLFLSNIVEPNYASIILRIFGLILVSGLLSYIFSFIKYKTPKLQLYFKLIITILDFILATFSLYYITLYSVMVTYLDLNSKGLIEGKSYIAILSSIACIFIFFSLFRFLFRLIILITYFKITKAILITPIEKKYNKHITQSPYINFTYHFKVKGQKIKLLVV